jgi:hypothetical protein
MNSSCLNKMLLLVGLGVIMLTKSVAAEPTVREILLFHCFTQKATAR